MHPDMLELVQHGSTDSFINNLFPEENKKTTKGTAGTGRQSKPRGGELYTMNDLSIARHVYQSYSDLISQSQAQRWLRLGLALKSSWVV